MTISTCPPPDGGSPAARTAALIGASALASLFLAACGGDGNSQAPMPPPPAAITQVPVSATTSDAALESFAFNLARTEDTDPLTLDLVTALPTSETEDPIATP
jgi:hypothetical protein